MQFMEMKAKLEAAGVKTDFPVRDSNDEMPDHETDSPMKHRFDAGQVEPIGNVENEG
jgi:hypothetical protein